MSSGESRPLHVWTSHVYGLPLPAHHPFPAAKYPRLVETLLAERVIETAHLHLSVPAPFSWIARVHDPAYVRRARRGEMNGDEIRRLGLPWSPELVRRARAAVFGTVQAALAALDHGVAGNLAGGSHHAFRDRGEGYCLFNDLAIAIAALRELGFARRPFVLDLDVHQGNGTAALFRDDSSVFTFSLHGEGNYPLRKVPGSFDRSLPDGSGDREYHAALERLPECLDRHRPDLVLYQAGVDPLAEDALGKLSLSARGLAERDERVFAWCEERELPVAVTLGGGYSRPIEASLNAHAALWRAARRARDARPPRPATAFAGTLPASDDGVDDGVHEGDGATISPLES